MQMVSAHMERCTTTDSSHSPSSDQTSISRSFASNPAICSLNVRDVSDMMMPDALFTTLCAASNTPMTMFHVLVTMSTAQAVLNIHLKNIQVSTSCILFFSVMS